MFFISAVFHELLVGVPLHMVKCWAFLGIMSQVRVCWCACICVYVAGASMGGCQGRRRVLFRMHAFRTTVTRTSPRLHAQRAT